MRLSSLLSSYSKNIINPELSKEWLDILLLKISENTATEEEYKRLDSFMDLVGIENGSILKGFQKENINSYRDFINERNKSILKGRNPVVDTVLYNTLLTAIQYLKAYLK